MKQFLKKSFILISFALLLILIMPITAEAKTDLNKKNVTLDAGKSIKLKLTGTKKKVTWSSSNKKIATVSSSGKVKAKSEGTATIRAKAGKKTYKCKVTVVDNSYWGNHYKEIAKAYKTGNSSRLSYTDKKVLAKVKKILSQNIRKDMPDEEKALVLHDWICKNTIYESYTKGRVSGYVNYVDVLFKGKACCAGYSGVYQLFMQCLGIDNQVAHGVTWGSNHAWNVIKIEGKWYNVDVTNDDHKDDKFTNIMFLVPDSLLVDCGYKITSRKKKCTSEDYMLYPYTKDISCYQVINSADEWKSYIIKNRNEGKKEVIFLTKKSIYVQQSEFNFPVIYEEQFHKGKWTLWKVSIRD